MALAAKLLREAAEEMTSAAAYYEKRREGLGAKFLDAVRATILGARETPLASTPWSVPRVTVVVRRRTVPGFPFFVVYMTDPPIVVVAIAHMRRRPGYWRARVAR